jgi:hypothetical protein
MQLLPLILNGDGQSNVVNITLSQGWLPEGEQTWFLQTSASTAPGQTDLVMVKLELIEGAGHVTWINVNDACLDLRVLPQLVAALPQLREFRCTYCNRCSATLPREARMLPNELHTAAHASLTSLDLSLTNVTGTLPKWENWTTLEVRSSSRTSQLTTCRIFQSLCTSSRQSQTRSSAQTTALASRMLLNSRCSNSNLELTMAQVLLRAATLLAVILCSLFMPCSCCAALLAGANAQCSASSA